MHIRSLIRVRLPKYFPCDRYIMNRSGRADAIFIDMENNLIDDKYKMKNLRQLQKTPFNLPIILADTVSEPNTFLPDIIKNPRVKGIAIRSRKETINEGFHNLDISKPETDTVFTMIWDTVQQRITHSIIAYQKINEHDIQWASRLQQAVHGSIHNKIQPMAARTARLHDTKSTIYEFQLLKAIGFTGVVLRNPNLIDIANDIFDK